MDKSPLVTIARGAADVARKPDRITLLKRGGSWRETVDRCRSRPRNYQPSLFVIGFVRIFLREEEFHPLERRERERLAPLMANNATLCALYASALLQDASFRCRESGGPFIPPKGEETRVGGVGIPRPGLMEIEGRTECFSS